MLVRKNPRSGNNEANKTLAEKIEDYIKENIDYINSSIELIFIEKEPEKNSLYETINKLGEVTNFELLKLPQLVSNIQKISAAYKVNIDENTARYLIECCGSGMQELINELRKVIEYAGAGGTITKESLLQDIKGLSNYIIDSNGKVNTDKKLTVENLKNIASSTKNSTNNFGLIIGGIMILIIVAGGIFYVKKVKK